MEKRSNIAYDNRKFFENMGNRSQTFDHFTGLSTFPHTRAKSKFQKILKVWSLFDNMTSICFLTCHIINDWNYNIAPSLRPSEPII
jgi:hypothetical protein